MSKKGFRDLVAWQEAKDPAVKIIRYSRESDLCREYWLKNQICRSAVSIASNIAEGDERDTDKEAVRYFYISKGSLAELRTQLQIAHESGLFNQAPYSSLELDCGRLGKILGGLIKSRQVSRPS